MNLEKLPPPLLSEQISCRIQELQNLITLLKCDLKKAPHGSLNISRCHNQIQYTKILNNKRIYLSKNNLEIIQKLAQADYNRNLIKVAQRELHTWKHIYRRFNKKTRTSSMINTSLYIQTINRNRQLLITPVTLPDELYGDLWQKQKWRIFLNEKNRNGNCSSCYGCFYVRSRYRCKFKI